MESLDTGKDKIKKICEILEKETLEPAKREAQQVVEVAQKKAQDIIREAERKAEQISNAAKKQREHENALFNSSLKSAAKQAVESLKQEIESKLFNDALSAWIDEQMRGENKSIDLIQVLVEAIKQEGISADLSAYVSKNIPPEKINQVLAKDIIEQLRDKEVLVADFIGGVKIKLHDKNLTLDLTEEAVKELLSKYLRKNFRDLLFQE